MEAHLPHRQDQLPKDLLTDQLKHQAIVMLVGLVTTIVMISTTPQNVSLMVVTVAKKIPLKDGTIIAKSVNVLTPLNPQLKLQWSAPFPNGPVTISVMTKTTTPSADLMEAIVVIMTARVGITTAASVSALKCQQLLKNPGIPLKTQWRPLKSPWGNVLPHNGLETIIVTMRTTPPSVDLMEEIVVITKWRATPTTAVLANAWNTQSQLKNLELTVLPHTGLEMPFVMMKTTPKSVDLMVEIVVTMKDKDGTTIVLIVNVFNKFYFKNVIIHYLISRNKSCSIT